MGTTSTREKIESKMLKLKLRRVEIKEERKERVKQLEKITGKEINRDPIPDYIDHSEDEINPEDIDYENEEIEDDEIITSKKKKNNKKEKKYYKEEEDDEESDSYYYQKNKKNYNKYKNKKKIIRHEVTKE